MAKQIDSYTKIAFASTYTRVNGQPMDDTVVWNSFEEAQDYARTDKAFVGQVITVVTNNGTEEEPAFTSKVYVVDNTDGDLVEVGAKIDIVPQTVETYDDLKYISSRPVGLKVYVIETDTTYRWDGYKWEDSSEVIQNPILSLGEDLSILQSTVGSMGKTLDDTSAKAADLSIELGDVKSIVEKLNGDENTEGSVAKLDSSLGSLRATVRIMELDLDSTHTTANRAQINAWSAGSNAARALELISEITDTQEEIPDDDTGSNLDEILDRLRGNVRKTKKKIDDTSASIEDIDIKATDAYTTALYAKVDAQNALEAVQNMSENLTGIPIVQETGDSTVSVMSQKAATDVLRTLDEVIGQQITFEDGKYVLVSGKIQNNDTALLTHPIAVIPSSKVTVTTYTHPNWAVGLFDGETLIGTAGMAVEGEFSLYTKEIDIPSNCNNIRVSTRKGNENKVVVAQKDIIDNIVKQYTGSITRQVKRGVNEPKSWENAIINNVGNAVYYTTRLASVGYLKNIDSVACNDGYTCCIVCYDENNVILGAWNGKTILSYVNDASNLASENFENIYAATTAKYFKIMLLKTDGSEISPSECSNITVMFRTSELEEKLLEEIEEASGSFSTDVTEDETFKKDIKFKSCFRASYKFPKDIHSVEGEYELFKFKAGAHEISVRFNKGHTGVKSYVPFDPVPAYRAGFAVYVNGTKESELIPDGWMKELLLGEDAMSIRFKGDCTLASNQGIRLKVDSDNIVIYNSWMDNATIASFAKSSYSTMRDLYEALKAATESSLSEFEVYPLTLDGLVPSDIIECDIPLVGQYYTDATETDTRYDAFPYYFTTKQEGKVYDVEMLFNKNARFPIQMLVNGYSVLKLLSSNGVVFNTFSNTCFFIVKDNTDAGIITEGIEFNDTSDLSKYPNIRVLYAEKIDEGLDNVYPNYSVSQNKVIGWASYMRSQGRQYIAMKDIERVFDGSMKVSSNYLWTFQLDDGSIDCVTNPNVRWSLLRSGIRPSIAMMLNKDVTEEDLKILRASENAGFEYHIHTGYFDAALPIAYYTYEQLNRNVEDALNRFIDIHGSVPTVWGKHSGLYHYGVSRYLKNKGIRINFAGNSDHASLNEITRFSCERNLIQEQFKYTDIKDLDNTY